MLKNLLRDSLTSKHKKVIYKVFPNRVDYETLHFHNTVKNELSKRTMVKLQLLLLFI